MAAVLLDLDGTLIDSRPGIIACLHYALTELGHQPDRQADLTWAIGPPIGESIARLLKTYGDDRVEAGLTHFRARYGSIGLFEASVYPGIRAALLALGAAHHDLYVATSKRRDYAQRVLDRFALANLMRGIYGAEPGGALDAKSDLIAHLLLERGIMPWRAVMVGDRCYDVAGAKANGLTSIGVLWGYGDRADLAGADALIEAPADLPAAVATF